MAASLPTTFKAVVTQSDLTLKVEEIPSIAAEQGVPAGNILVKVKAVGINPIDWTYAYNERFHYPNRVLGCDLSGDVVALGADVTHFRLGDRVAGVVHGCQVEGNGAFAEYVLLKELAAFRMPAGMRYEEGAAWGIADFTYLLAACVYHRLPLPSLSSPTPTRNEAVFIWGGATSIGWHAIQLAKLLGLKVLTVASSKHHATLREIGADEVYDYKDVDVVDRLKKTVQEWGNVKYGFDAVTGGGTTENSVDILAETPGGAHLCVVLPAGLSAEHRNPSVKVTSISGFTLLGDAYSMARVRHFAPEEAHAQLYGEYNHAVLPRILEGWTSPRGSAHFRAQKLIEIKGGLEKVDEAVLRLHHDGVSGEKIVITL
ncbi:Zinc-binding oxidoreductase alcohol dehydrogenase [Tilletia horrida]|uniref:Zinc-binding oxidoreductase alcohol dehydrogenase n=1 Tax=Tilletia horrida TaxID=155126 RepID=A0AAN6JJU2_9BASI|nr:Zinc-binding oxidoreductase alcohol dehydrogenase [Tilletia horrida]